MLRSNTLGCSNISRKVTPQPVLHKRAQSASPVAVRSREPYQPKKIGIKGRRCQSLSPQNMLKKSHEKLDFEQTVSAPDNSDKPNTSPSFTYQEQEKEIVMPQCVLTKTMRLLATKKREFLKLRKNLITQQNSFLEHFATLRELEVRAGMVDYDGFGEIRILSLKGWPAHDLLLLVRDDLEMPVNSEISGKFGLQVIQQIQSQLNPIPEEVLGMGAELMARRIDILGLLRDKHRNDRTTYLTNLEWKKSNVEFDNETEQLHRMVAGVVENLKAKITYALDLVKIPWKDRDTLIKKSERLQKENAMLTHKVDELSKKGNEENTEAVRRGDDIPNYQKLLEELAKERQAKDSLKEIVSSAESMLRVARSRISSLERQIKDLRCELETAKRKHRDLEQLYRHRETSYDQRSRKLLEVSKTGEMTIETLSRQRDALELRVKELREQAEEAERSGDMRSAELRSRAESLQAKVAVQEKNIKAVEDRMNEVEQRNKELEEQLYALRERSTRLVDMERRHCLEYLPSKETEPSDRETEIWKELQVTKVALARAEEELRQSRADKDSFLNSLSRIAQEEGADKEDKMAAELLKREKKIMKLKSIIEEQRDNEKIMEQSMTDYENQLAALRLEVKRLRNYECYSKEPSYQDLQTELLQMHMEVETLSRERSALVTAAASRALMLERHERAAELFAKMTRARRVLAAHIEGREELPENNSGYQVEVTRSLTSICTCAADTWSALRAERARVLRLESAVLAQSLQLDREGRVRTQLERRKALLERELLKARHSVSAPHKILTTPNSTMFFE